AASPAEARILDAGAADAVVHWRGDARRQDAEIGLDDLDHESTLSIVKIAGRNADRVERADVGLVLGHLLPQSSARKDRRLALGIFQRAHQLSGRIFLAAHGPQPGVRLCRPGAQEERGHGHAIACYSELAREMMPLEAPTPGLRAAGITEHGDVI